MYLLRACRIWRCWLSNKTASSLKKLCFMLEHNFGASNVFQKFCLGALWEWVRKNGNKKSRKLYTFVVNFYAFVNCYLFYICKFNFLSLYQSETIFRGFQGLCQRISVSRGWDCARNSGSVQRGDESSSADARQVSLSLQPARFQPRCSGNFVVHSGNHRRTGFHEATLGTRGQQCMHVYKTQLASESNAARV